MAAARFWGFYKKRQLIYGGLLLFVVVVGLPIVAVPPLRNRLSGRMMILKAAMAGDVEPLNLKVGEKHEPFPAEYERPAPPLPILPQVAVVDKAHSMPSGVYVPPSNAPRIRTVPGIEKMKMPRPAPAEIGEAADQVAAADAAPSTGNEPKYQTGKDVQEAYELLLQSNAAIAGMIKGSDSSLHFKSWDVAARGNDTYWVRIKFTSEGNPDIEYIWQVKLDTKQVTPLSYNARTLS